MTQETINIPSTAQAPTVRALAIASIIALLVAAILLVTIIFPAEYGIDSLGTGEALGLSALSGSTAVGEPVPPPQGTRVSPVQEGLVALYPAEYKLDSREFVLGP